MALPVELACIAAFLGLAILGLALDGVRHRSTLFYAGGFVVATIGLTAALAALLNPELVVPTMTLPLGIPWLGSHLRLDPLASFFLVVVDLGAAVASLYGIGYGRHEKVPGRVLPFFALFIAAMHVVVLADDAYTFLWAWESMSLASWALVVAHHRGHGTLRAGYLYLLMASFGTLALMLAFGLMAGDGLGFDQIRATPQHGWALAVILGLAILGAGSKAGLVPLHVWLPLAHPAAPSHVSALMSGVMTKVAIYGFIRIVFDLLGEPDWQTSLVILGLGSVSALLGVMQAVVERDLKRLLAYCTVENVGIVFIGLGLALAFRANHMGWAAALALTAALFHVLNHMIVKSLLFFGAGAVLTATGERSMDRLGGLLNRMPVTGFAFLIGSMAIAALPPLNGFVSEWMIFQAILVSPALPQWGLRILIPASGAMLALAAAFAAACFVKAFGLSFLGRPRSSSAAGAREVDRFSLAAMLGFAGLALLAGIFPGFVVDALAPVVSTLVGNRVPEQTPIAWFSLVPIGPGRSSYNGLLVFLFILSSAGLAAAAIHRFASQARRRAPAWDCGYPETSPLTQYSADSFAQPIRRVFGNTLFRTRIRVEMPPPGDLHPALFEVELHDVIWERLYAPIAGLIGAIANRLNVFQFLTIRQYLSLVFGALVLLLLVLAIWV